MYRQDVRASVDSRDLVATIAAVDVGEVYSLQWAA